MSWIEKIRQKSQTEKIKLIWIICGAIGIILIVVWIFTTKIGTDQPKDTSLFKTIVKGLKNLK